MAVVGQTYLSGERATAGGDFEYYRHIAEESTCSGPSNKKVALAKLGDFPQCDVCKQTVVWRLTNIKQA